MIFKILLSRSVQTPNSDNNWQTSCPLQTFVCNISRHLEFIIEQGHRVNWVSESLDSQVTGSHNVTQFHVCVVPRLNTYGRRVVSVAGPMAWNSRPDFIRVQRAAQTVLGVYLKRTCWLVTSVSSTLGVLNDYALYTYPRTHSLIRHNQLIRISHRQIHGRPHKGQMGSADPLEKWMKN